MLILANVLLILSAAAMLMLMSSRPGPEGPVGAHVATVPLALAQAFAVGVAIDRGAFDGLPMPRAVGYGLLVGFVLVMALLPFFGWVGGAGATWARVGVVVTAVAVGASLNGRAVGLPPTLITGAATVVSSVGVAGYVMIATFLVCQQMRAAQKIEAGVVREQEFATEQAAWQHAEFAKLPPDAALWQLIQFSHAFHPDVQRECLARIAALPTLEADMNALLGTGWAEHALPYVKDFYPLPHRNLAPAYAAFLDQELASWKPRLESDPHAGTWEVNLRKHVDVAERITADGGDLRPQVTGWHEFLRRMRGFEDHARRWQKLLGSRKR